MLPEPGERLPSPFQASAHAGSASAACSKYLAPVPGLSPKGRAAELQRQVAHRLAGLLEGALALELRRFLLLQQPLLLRQGLQTRLKLAIGAVGVGNDLLEPRQPLVREPALASTRRRRASISPAARASSALASA